jgi:glycosyltransferase involved in cell wall biosynthesis
MAVNQAEDRLRRRVVEFAKQRYLRLFDGFVVGGETHAAYLEGLGVPRRKMTIGYNCVDNAGIASAVRAERASNARLVLAEDYFLCVSRLVSKKNLLMLIGAYKGYVEQVGESESLGQPWRLVVVGGGDLRPALEDRIRELGLEGLVLLPGREDDFRRVVNYYAFAKALVLASAGDEQWGLVVNEAMAAGLPVVVSKQCGCSQHLVVEGKNGFTFDGRSLEELKQRLVWLHEHRERLDSMGVASREIVERYSPRHFAENVEALWNMVGARR